MPVAAQCLAEVDALEKKLMEAGKVLTPVAAAAYVLGFLAGKTAKSIYVVDCGSGASRVYM